MNISQVYVYINKNGEIVSKTPYKTGSIRQGDDFILNVLFDKDETKPSLGNVLSVLFKIPSQKEYNLFPFLSYDQQYVSEKQTSISKEFVFSGPIPFTSDIDLSKYGIEKGITYDCWSFNSASAYKGKALLTNIDGNLEVQIIKYNNENKDSYTQYAGTFRIFVEKTLHYENPFDVKQEDLDRFIEEVTEISKEQAQDVVVDVLPEEYVIEVKPNTFIDKNGEERTESLTLTHRKTVLNEETRVFTQTDEQSNVEMPLPLIKEEINVNSSHEIEEQTASIAGTGKEKNPLIFSLNLHKARDGYGIHAFYIDETTGELMVKAERSDDLVEENYKINENGELIIEL